MTPTDGVSSSGSAQNPGSKEKSPDTVALATAPATRSAPEDASGRMGGLVGAPYVEQSTFRRGELLQKRFKILRFIAKGGAGEVYEAQDLELRCPVALKVARPEVCGNDNAMERFRREIALARQVTHPNVCRIFDIFRQQIAGYGGHHRETLFLTMELLNGQSLASRIHRHGPLTPEEALPLIKGMVDGLNAAHKVGVIHRDFKSANVVLVEELDGTRAVITDFGLARGNMQDNSNPDITMSGTVVGTPNYMSPEQLTGGEITPAVDMYALGIVIYEMMTGTRPFKGETDLSTAVKRLTEPPASPRVHVPDLDPVWERVILRCLERDPEDRFPNLSDIPRALSGEVPQSTPPSMARAQRKRTAWIAAIVLPILVAVGIFAATYTKGTDAPPIPIGEVLRPKAAVLEFRNLSGDPKYDWLSSAMAEMINGELAASGSVNMIPREDVTRALAALGLEDSGTLPQASRDEFRNQTHTELIVEGAYLVLPGGQLRLQLRAHQPTGDTTTVTEEGSEEEMFDLINRSSERLRVTLGLVDSPTVDPEEITQPGEQDGAAAPLEVEPSEP